MEEKSVIGRSKPKKLRVRFPDGVEFCYSSSKETFLETLRKIGGEELSHVKLEVCHLPMFSQKIYERYKDFMEPIGEGWYVNTQGDSYTKFLQLMTINKQLNIGLEIDMSEDFKGERVKRGERSMCILEVEFPDGETIGEENTAETFMQCIWKLGIDKVMRLNLKQGGKDLITFTKQYNGQVQVDANRWLIIPGSLKDKVKLLRVIGVMLHLRIKITHYSDSEAKQYKKIGSGRAKARHEQENMSTKFRNGDYVSHMRYGKGVVLSFDSKTKLYKVEFYEAFKGLSKKYQIKSVPEDSLINDVEAQTNFSSSNKSESSYRVTEGSQTDKSYNVYYKDNVLINNQSEQASLVKRRNIHCKILNQKSANRDEKKADKTFSIGDKVFHKQFGQGYVIDHYVGTNSYKVNFFLLEVSPIHEIDGNELNLLKHRSSTIEENKHEMITSKISCSSPVQRKMKKTSAQLPSRPQLVPQSLPKFNIGDKVYNVKYGLGEVVMYYKFSKTYDVRFSESLKDLPLNKQIKNCKEKKLEPADELLIKKQQTNEKCDLNSNKVEK
jgi:hypothetical protein